MTYFEPDPQDPSTILFETSERELRRAVDEASELFEPAAGTIYLDSATYGLPPKTTVIALQRALEQWRGGTGRWIEDWEAEGEACRALFARLIHGRSSEVALLPAVSVATGLVATSVPKGGEVLTVEGDFTSVLYPFLAAQERGELTVRESPVERLAEAIRPQTALVAFSLVRSSDGNVADLTAIRSAADSCDARLYVDASQALGMLPVNAPGSGIDYLSCAGYKWLCSPRGTAFLWMRPELVDSISPITASWRGGDDPYGRYYGSPLALASDAARFHVSLAWHSWVGARASLELLASLDDHARFERAHNAARILAERLELEVPASSIVSIPVERSQEAGRALEAVGLRISVRAGAIRISPHFYNRVDQAEFAAERLRPYRRR